MNYSKFSFERHRFFATHSDLLVNSTVTETIRDILEEEEEEQVLILQPGAEGIDSHVWTVYPNQNFGDVYALWAASHSGSPHYRSFIKFDLSSIPIGSDITSATLMFNGRGSSSDTGYSIISLHRVLSSWDEHTITWNNQPPYAEYSIDTEDIDQYSEDMWYSLNVTSPIEDWVQGEYQNYGFVIRQLYENRYRTFLGWSSDGGGTRHPKLEIHYLPP